MRRRWRRRWRRREGSRRPAFILSEVSQAWESAK